MKERINDALAVQLVELTGSAEERVRVQAEREKDARVESMAQRVTRQAGVCKAGGLNGYLAARDACTRRK